MEEIIGELNQNGIESFYSEQREKMKGNFFYKNGYRGGDEMTRWEIMTAHIKEINKGSIKKMRKIKNDIYLKNH